MSDRYPVCRKVALLALLAAYPVTALAQDSSFEPISCGLSFPSFAANDSHWVGALAAYANTKSLEYDQRRAFADIVNNRLPGELKHMGNLGYLLEFQVVISRTDGLQHKRLNFVELHGVGVAPVDALVASATSDRLRPGVPDGFTPSPDDSYFVWMKRKAGKLVAGCISPPASSSLQQDANGIVGSEKLLKLAKQVRQNAIYHQLALYAQANASSSALANRLAALEAQREATHNELVKINENLERALEAESRGKGLMQTLELVKGALEIVNLVNLASAALNDPGVDFSKSKNHADVMELTRTYTMQKGEAVVTYKSQLTVQGKISDDAKKAWVEGFSNAGTPATLIPKP